MKEARSPQLKKSQIQNCSPGIQTGVCKHSRDTAVYHEFLLSAEADYIVRSTLHKRVTVLSAAIDFYT